jgi:hypothetical protein
MFFVAAEAKTSAGALVEPMRERRAAGEVEGHLHVRMRGLEVLAELRKGAGQ